MARRQKVQTDFRLVLNWLIYCIITIGGLGGKTVAGILNGAWRPPWRKKPTDNRFSKRELPAQRGVGTVG